MPKGDKDKDEVGNGKEWFRTLVQQLRAGGPVDLGGANLPGWAERILDEELPATRPEGVRTSEAMEQARATGQPVTIKEA